MNTFNHKGNYTCDCGKEFTNSQSFNAHKSSCKIHMMNKGMSEEDYYTLQSNRRKSRSIGSSIIRAKRVADRYSSWSESILDGSHKCENCGKVITEIYASGRFCCEYCARSYVSRTQSEKSKSEKVSKLVKGWKLYGKPSYPETYWASIFDSLNLSYETQVPIKSPNRGFYRIDFVINNVVAVEIDGGFHYIDGILRDKDKFRDKVILNSSNYRIIRIKYTKDKDAISSQIRDLLEFIEDNLIRYKLI